MSRALIAIPSGNWWAGAAAGAFYFIGREMAQAEDRYIDANGGSGAASTLTGSTATSGAGGAGVQVPLHSSQEQSHLPTVRSHHGNQLANRIQPAMKDCRRGAGEVLAD